MTSRQGFASTLGAATLWLALSGCAGPRAYLATSDGPWLVYERTPCFGPCPAFELEVDRNGSARFHGRRNVTPEGNQVATWSEEDRQAVADAAHAVRSGTSRPTTFDACLGRSERGTAGAVYRKQSFLEFREVLLSN